MKILRRFLLCLWSLALIATAAVVGVCAFRPVDTQYYLDKLYYVLIGGQYFWWLLLAAVVLLLGGMLGVFASLARKPAPPQVVIGKSEGGQVNICLDAVDNVVHKAALSVPGVREVKSRIKAAKNGVSIKMQIGLPHDTNVPETSTEVQKVVKEQLQVVTGLAVAEVTVLVATVSGLAVKTAREQNTIL
jgi:uncharacterized alkaline shock family protein YloU